MPREFLIGDSTFKASPNMTPCFKKPAHGEMPAKKKFCSNKIAKPRVKSEHCIGILKGRFNSSSKYVSVLEERMTPKEQSVFL
jgi:hypothetical protein